MPFSAVLWGHAVIINRFSSTMLLFLILILGYLVYQIMSPFLTAIAWAIVFSIIFYPVYAFLARRIKVKAIASALTIVVILLVIIGPITYLSFMLVEELQTFVNTLNQDRLDEFKKVYEDFRSSPIVKRIGSYVGGGNLTSEEAIMDSIEKIGKGLLETVSGQIRNVLSIVINFLFMLFTTFFLLKDGSAFLTKAGDFMPFGERHKNRLAKQVKDMIFSTVYGGAAVAIIQGSLGGLIFYALNLSSPVMWGTAMSVMSFVPVIGTFSIWGTASVYLLLQGSFLKGIVLFLFGIFVISMTDNILRPMIIGSRSRMPTVLILFSVLGGINLMGMIGFVMGPLIMAVFVSVFEIFRHVEDELEEDLAPRQSG
jgi:predicted PurR-regulated permease PerM